MSQSGVMDNRHLYAVQNIVCHSEQSEESRIVPARDPSYRQDDRELWVNLVC